LRFCPTPFALLPRGFLKPTLQFVLNPIANLLKLIPQPGGLLAHLIAKAPGSTQEFLTHTGPGQGQIIQLPQGGDDPTALLVDDAVGAEPPAAAAGKPGIAAGNQVVEDATATQFDCGIGHMAQVLAIGPDQGRFKQGGQALKGGGIGIGWESFDKSLLLAEAPELIEAPHLAALAKGGRATHPAEQAMDGGMHPAKEPRSMVGTLITAHAPGQQVTQ
jgi:hypothetical protein